MKNKLLLFDNCLVGECNMHCAYCREVSEGSVSKKTKDNFLKSISAAGDVFDIPILKVSGYGEFLILPKALDILKDLSGKYERVQVMTNGVILNEKLISQLAKMRGMNVCVSLDGHTPLLNRSRTDNNALIKKILGSIKLLREYDIPVEINSVITKYNISGFPSFIGYLSDKYAKGLTCYPFALRGADHLAVMGPKNALKLKPLLDRFDDFSNVLPARQYIKRLLSFIKEGARRDKCYVGYTNLGIDPSGDILVCACSIKTPVGNIFHADNAFKNRAKHPAFSYFLLDGFILENCRRCFTHYEMINLYLDGTIGLDEISKIHLFSEIKTKKRLSEYRRKLEHGAHFRF